MVTLNFRLNEEGRSRYEICYQAIACSEKAVPVADWDDAVSVLKKLKVVGRPAEKAGIVQLYDLADSAEVSLERSEYKLLLDHVERPIWKASFLERVQDTRTWLKLNAEDVKPEVKRRGGLVVQGG